MILFDNLSDTQKIAYYQQMAVQALERYPLKVVELTCIPIRHNVIFRVDTNNSSYMLRIGYPEVRTSLMVASEMRWLEDLQEQVTFECPCPVRTIEGDLFIRLMLDSIPYERLIVVTT